jgi:hemerythrin
MQSAWNPSLLTGVDQVDREHQEIFWQAALLNQAVSEGKGIHDFKKIIDFVDDYLISHFVHEEEVMERYSCPAADENRLDHDKFIAEFKVLKNLFDTRDLNTALVSEIASSINDWLIQHIRQIDSQLSDCMKNSEK